MSKVDSRLRQFVRNVRPEERNEVLNELVAQFYQAAPWSNITPEVNDVRQATGGTGIAFYYKDPDTGQVYVPMVIPVKLVDSSINYRGLDEKYQIPGGHINFAEKETLIEACLRENEEEVAGAEGPILHDIDESQLVPLDNLLIYLGDYPRYVSGFGLELSKDQFDKMKHYSDECIDITPYTKDHEIRGIRVLTLDQILANPEKLHHQDQLSLFRKLKAHIDSTIPMRDLRMFP